MLTLNRHLIAALALSAGLLALSPALAVPPADPVEAGGKALIARFQAALESCGLQPPYTPGVIVDSRPSLVSFFLDDRSVHLSRWAEMPDFVHELLTGWAADGTLGLTPEAQFAEIFNSLLVPHELGHFVQSLDGRWNTLDNWTAEVEANRIAIAFWSLDPDDAARIAARVENFKVFLSKLPDPVPPGEDPHAYFEANYEKLSNDPAAYGWYQGAFMRAAWADRGKADFCALVKPASP